MGCTSAAVVEQRRILPLPPETVNSYIDKFPAIILQKIKEKFQIVADKETREVDRLSFLRLFATAGMREEGMLRLFEFFNDHRKDNLRFRRFMSKYATITKCEPSLLFKIFFQIYKENIDSQSMNRQQCLHALAVLNQFCHDKPNPISSGVVTQDIFVDLMSMIHFDHEEFQKRMTITTEEDIPFHAISQELHESDFNDIEKGQWYYLLSNDWYNRWSFYYQEAHTSFDKTHIKSTKMLNPLDQSKVMARKRKSSIQQTRKPNSSSILRTSQLGNSLIEQPHTIDFDDIQGEYKGQLKDKLKISVQIKIITANLWKLLCTLHPPEQSFKRKAIDEQNIEYYPKTIFYCEADSSGRYIVESYTIKHLSLSESVSILFESNVVKSKQIGVFAKNFEEKNWREVDLSRKGADVSLDPRFFMVFAQDREKFIKQNYRAEVNSKTLDLGDKVFAYFPYVKTVAEGCIVQTGKEDKFKIHFKGYSYRYELFISREDITIQQSSGAQLSSKKRHETLIRGINNIGNTCFMNSIIQCLVATPVLDKFLQEFPFNQDKNPIGFGLSKIASSLLLNQKPTPSEFKKLIDVHMPLFSGYDQHDAQQFLNLLLDKISEELPEKPTVIDYLFAGKARSKLTCPSCSNVKNIDEKMYILSLPLPEAEFNYYSVIIVPISSYSIKKIIFKLHKSATINDYLAAFDEKTGENNKNYNFCESNNNSLKKIKSELTTPGYQNKMVTDLGIVPNISLLAYEKVSLRLYYDLLKAKTTDEFKDFQSISQAYWTVCKISAKQVEKADRITVEYINQQNQLEKTKIEKDKLMANTTKLGTQTSEPQYKKIILRKFNSSLKKLEHFGIEFLIGIPKWASYNDIISLVEKYITNLKTKDAQPFTQKESGDYVIRLLDPVKVRCIFCLKANNYFGITESDLHPCCSAFDKDVPLAWAYKHRSYWIYIDWINFSTCNSSFCSYIEVDPLSKKVEESRQLEYINLEECIRLHNQHQKVEMECDKCKEKFQHLEHQIGAMPNILIVHMKEFRYTAEGHLIKLDLRLKWQEFLDVSKFAIASQGKLYELFALVRHSGNSQSGHYTCMAKRKHPFENKKIWVNFDDDLTEIVKQQQKFIDDAYLLFYKKVDMPTSSLVIYSDLRQI